MRFISYILLTVLLGACGSVPRDPTAAPIDNNLYTAELHACGKVNVGLVTCNFTSTEDLSQKALELPLFNKGEYQIKSTKCNYSVNKSFEGNQILKLTFAELMANRLPDQAICDFDIKVFISGMDRGFRGILSLVNSDRPLADVEFWTGSKLASFKGAGEMQMRAGSNPEQFFKYLTDKPGTLVWFGCDVDGEKDYQSNPVLRLDEVFFGGLIPEKSCILETGFIPANGDPAQVFTVNIQIFTRQIVQLPDPKLEYNGKRLKVSADPVVAMIAINDTYKIKHGDGVKTLSRKVEKDEVVWVRIASANGRYNLYKVLNGEIIWTSLIRY